MLRRLIAHLDMDAFFASVELLRYPELRGQAVVVGGGRSMQPETGEDGRRSFKQLGHYVGRGVVTTCTYEARAFGVHSAMGMMKAARLAPHALVLPADFEEYKRYSRLFKASIAAIAPTIEDRGIDEIYIDLTDVPGAQEAVDGDPLGGARRLAARIKDAVREATGLTCSIGVTPNKLLAKLCSEFDKPDGLTIVMAEDIPARIWPLEARKVNGIGPKASVKLAALGLKTVGEIAAADPLWLVEQFGTSYGTWLHEASHGRDERPVVTSREPKSISRETTFERDLHAVRDKAQLSGIFTHLCTKLAEDLLRKGYVARHIGLKLRYDDFRTVTRDITLPRPVDDAASIRRAAGECLKRVPLERRLRLLGVKAGSLVNRSELAPGLEPHGAEAAEPSLVAASAPKAASRPPARRSGQQTLPLFDDALPPG